MNLSGKIYIKVKEGILMGSSGTGEFGNYKKSRNSMEAGSDQSGAQGESGQITCPKVLEEIRLEDVEQLTFYKTHGAPPTIGHQVKISENLLYGRLVVISLQTSEPIGNVPTKYNYIYSNCISSGVTYTGEVISSGISPIPYTVVTLNAK